MDYIKKNRYLGWLFVIAGLIAFFFSFLITVEKIALLADPDYLPGCSVNKTVNCATVMSSPEASIFGFPNPLLGIAGFSIIITMGFALLSGATFKRWFWQGVQLGLTLAVIFVYWLFSVAVFQLLALCPYCMVVWAMTIPLFLCTTFYNLEEGHLLGERIKVKFWVKSLLFILMYGVIIGSILLKLGDSLF